MKSSYERFLSLASGVPGVSWPPLPGRHAAALTALAYQLEQTQWLSPQQIRQGQSRQLASLVTQLQHYSGFFRARLARAGMTAGELKTVDALSALPVLTRRELQSAGPALFSTRLPQAHLPTGETCTSGSCGEPVVVRRTAINQLFWLANTLREHFWHERDFGRSLAIIRANLAADGSVRQRDWGPPVGMLFNTGPAYTLSIMTDAYTQGDWLKGLNPGYLLTYPTNLAVLLDSMQNRGIVLSDLLQVRTIGETVSLELRERVRDVLNVDVADIYSSHEVGIVAVQCPVSGWYHVMAESLLVEVLDADDRPCQPGEVGKVVVTDLHNFATPLVRYAIGDYAEVGADCPCGRGLPVLNRIMGRRRNMLTLPDGRRYWPLGGFRKYRDVVPVRQFQLIQRSLHEIEVRLVVDERPTSDQEHRMGNIIRQALGYPFRLAFVYFDKEIPRSSGGKFEEFISEIG